MDSNTARDLARAKNLIIKLLNDTEMNLTFNNYDFGKIQIMSYYPNDNKFDIHISRDTDQIDEDLFGPLSPSHQIRIVDAGRLLSAFANYGYDLDMKFEADEDYEIQDHINYLLHREFAYGLERLYVVSNRIYDIDDDDVKVNYFTHNYILNIKGDIKDLNPSILKIAAGLDYELRQSGIINFIGGEFGEPFKDAPGMAVRVASPNNYAVTAHGKEADEILSIINENHSESEAYGYLYDIARVIKKFNLYATIDLFD
jgi:hypothetical protein